LSPLAIATAAFRQSSWFQEEFLEGGCMRRNETNEKSGDNQEQVKGMFNGQDSATPAVTLPRFHVHQTHAAFRLRSKSAGDR
jgi:hypothetical protein